MPKLTFRHYANLKAIRVIDKKYFNRLLSSHKTYCASRGLDVDTLANDDASNEALFSFFSTPDPQMPANLLEALHKVDDLADTTGHDLLIGEAALSGIDMTPGRSDVDPRELAIIAYLDYRSLFVASHDRVLYAKVKNFREFAGKKNRRLALPPRNKLEELEKKLAPWFGRMKRSKYCDIRAYQDGDEINFIVAHGRPYRRDNTVEPSLSPSLVSYRPEKHDVIIYDNKTYRLKVNAQTPPEQKLYPEMFGDVFFGSPAYFGGDPIYTLIPLQMKGIGALDASAVSGIDSVTLAEVWLDTRDDLGTILMCRSDDAARSIDEHGTMDLTDGKLFYAKMFVKFSGGGRARKLEIKVPNQLIYDRRKGWELVSEFLELQRFAKKPAESEDEYDPDE